MEKDKDGKRLMHYDYVFPSIFKEVRVFMGLTLNQLAVKLKLQFSTLKYFDRGVRDSKRARKTLKKVFNEWLEENPYNDPYFKQKIKNINEKLDK